MQLSTLFPSMVASCYATLRNYLSKIDIDHATEENKLLAFQLNRKTNKITVKILRVHLKELICSLFEFIS